MVLHLLATRSPVPGLGMRYDVVVLITGACNETSGTQIGYARTRGPYDGELSPQATVLVGPKNSF
eukprot:463576-Rhodomonas_salina.1